MNSLLTTQHQKPKKQSLSPAKSSNQKLIWEDTVSVHCEKTNSNVNQKLGGSFISFRTVSCQLDLFQFVEGVSPLIQDASSGVAGF